MEQNCSPKNKKGLKAAIVISLAIIVASLTVALVYIIVFANGGVKKDEFQNAVVVSAIALLLGIAVLVTARYNYRVCEQKTTRRGIFSTKNITRISIMTAVSYVLYMFAKFNLPFFPLWLDIQISDVPALLCGFMMGPASGCLVTLFKVLLKLPFSSSLMVGELADFLIGIAFVLPSSLIYKFHKSKKGALIGLAVGLITSTGVAVLINWLILIPWYVFLLFGNDWNKIVGMCSALYPDITVNNFYFWYLLCAALPFNLLRGLVSVIVTFFVYKSLGKLFNKMVPKRQN